MKKDSIFRDALILFLITFVLSVLLSRVKVMTQGRIDMINEEILKKAYLSVCENYYRSEDVTSQIINSLNISKASLRNCNVAYNEEGEKCGYIVSADIAGYGGNINVLVGFTVDGEIRGIEYPESLQETPGIGMRVLDEDFKKSFVGLSYDNYDNVDTLTGATISSTAVLQAVSLATDCVNKMKNRGI